MESEHVTASRPNRKREAKTFTPEEEKELRDTYHYEPGTGDLIWKIRGKGRKFGQKAGHSSGTDGRWRVRLLNGKLVSDHRLAFFLMMGRWPLPGMEVDHRDNNPRNNRWENLREATRSQNGCNRKIQSNNTSGMKGVFFDKTRRKWVAEIKLNNKKIRLGRFDLIEDAAAAYAAAAIRLHGEFANLGLHS